MVCRYRLRREPRSDDLSLCSFASSVFATHTGQTTALWYYGTGYKRDLPPPRTPPQAKRLPSPLAGVTVADAARHAGLEPWTFLRRFVQATGMRPSEYQQRLRISRARELLESSRKSVANITLSVGYEDVGGFRRVFRKIVGLTPSDYRRRFSRLSRAG